MSNYIMNIDLTFLSNEALIAMLAFTFLYLTYFFSEDFKLAKKVKSRLNETKEEAEKIIYYRRIRGFVLLGLVPFLIVLIFFDRPLTDYGLGLPSGDYTYLWLLGSIIVIVGGSLLKSKKSIDVTYYPEVRKKYWGVGRILMNSAFWTIYLLGYEFGLRGMVFFACLYAFGLWPAIIISTMIYSLIHIFKGAFEAYGAIFIGILFCLVIYYTNSIWIVLFVHVLMAVINDIKAVQASPDRILEIKKPSKKNAT